MHYLYYVAVPKAKNTANEAKEIAMLTLENNNFASATGGFWGNSKCDWYEIGGRWSGFLSEKSDSVLLDKKLFATLTESVEKSLEPHDFFDHNTEVALLGEEGYVEDEMTLQAFLEMKNIINNYYLVVIDYHN